MTDRERQTEEQLKNAIGEFTDQVEPADDAWAQLRGRADNLVPRHSRKTWIGLALAGAAAAIIAVLGFAALNSGDDDTRVATDPGDDMTGFVALTLDGQLRRYAPDGSDRGLIAETGWQYDEGDDFPPPPDFSVSSGGTVYFARPVPDSSCAVDAQLGSEIVSVPLEGGDPEVVVPVGTAPAVSPDGSSLAYLTTDSRQQCFDLPELTPGIDPSEVRTATSPVLEIKDLDRPSNLDSVDIVTAGERSFATGDPLVWSPDGSAIVLNAFVGGEKITPHIVLVDVATGSGRDLYTRSGLGTTPFAFDGENNIFVDATDFEGSSVRIGLIPADDVEQAPNAASVTVVHEVPAAESLRALSTLPGENAPGLLTVVEKNASPQGAGPVIYFGPGQDGAQRTLATDMVDAAWIPGTTAADLVAPTVSTGFVGLTGEGELRHYGASGEDLGLVADTGWKPGSDFAQPTFSVARDGTVYFSRAVTDLECPRSDQFGSEIVSVPINGGEPDVVAPVGSAPAISPDGSQLAFSMTGDEKQCYRNDGGDTSVVVVRDLGSSESRKVTIHPDNELPELVIPPGYPLAWSPDGSEIAVSLLLGKEQQAAVAVADLDNFSARTVFMFGTGDGTPALASAGEKQLFVDASRGTGEGAGWIGITDTDVPGPATVDTMRVPQFIGLPGAQRLLTLSTLPGENAPGLLVTTAPVLDSQSGTASVYSDGQESAPRVVAENVLAAVWISGTTDDVSSAPAPWE